MRKQIAKIIGYPLHDFVKHTKILSTLSYLMESQYWDNERILNLQINKIKKLVNHAFNNVPYYRHLFIKERIHPNDIKTFEEFKKEMPEAYAARDTFNDRVYENGALSTKMKRLIAMSMAVRIGCPGCIAYQTKLAVAAGATKKEVVEAAAVATSMGGTSASAWVSIVVQTMKELGKW